MAKDTPLKNPKLHYVALETKGQHPPIDALYKALKTTASLIEGVETSNHLLLGFRQKDQRSGMLTLDTFKVGSISYPVKAWPIDDTSKIRLKVGLETPVKEIAKAVKKFVPVHKIIMETHQKAPAWKNGFAHFFIPKTQVPKHPDHIDIGSRKVKVRIQKDKVSQPPSVSQDKVPPIPTNPPTYPKKRKRYPLIRKKTQPQEKRKHDSTQGSAASASSSSSQTPYTTQVQTKSFMHPRILRRIPRD